MVSLQLRCIPHTMTFVIDHLLADRKSIKLLNCGWRSPMPYLQNVLERHPQVVGLKWRSCYCGMCSEDRQIYSCLSKEIFQISSKRSWFGWSVRVLVARYQWQLLSPHWMLSLVPLVRCIYDLKQSIMHALLSGGKATNSKGSWWNTGVDVFSSSMGM